MCQYIDHTLCRPLWQELDGVIAKANIKACKLVVSGATTECINGMLRDTVPYTISVFQPLRYLPSC